MVKETKHRRTLTNRYSSDRHSADRLAVQAVCYANLVMSTTLPIPLSASLTAERRELLFPTLSPAQIERIAAHGKRRRVSAGKILVEQGDQNLPFFVVISGALEILRPNGNE